jgi:sec-independent protein translocase protein TatB
MFDIGWTEMMVLAIVAVVIVGPKDLPKVIRTVGKWVGKARSMAREFQSSLDDIARESELDDLKKQIDKAGSEFEKAARDTADQADFGKELEHTIDPSGTLDKVFDEPDPAIDANADLPATPADKPEAVTAAPANSDAAAEEVDKDGTPTTATPRTGT